MKIESIPVIDEFLNQWKVRATDFYLRAEADYKENKDNFQSEKYKLDGREIIISAREKSAQYFNNKYGKGVMQIVKYEMYRLDDILTKEVEGKKIKLIASIEKKTGTIQDASHLYVADSGEINGYIIGDKARVNVNTIYAGGYNIQCLHFRTLIKEV